MPAQHFLKDNLFFYKIDTEEKRVMVREILPTEQAHKKIWIVREFCYTPLLPYDFYLPGIQTYRGTLLQYSEYSRLNILCIYFSSSRTIAWWTATTNAPSRITAGFPV